MSKAPAEGLPDETSPMRDPRHVFLDAREVMQRYGWGKTKGYVNLKDRGLVPPPVMIHPDRWRLDQLLAWEDRRIAAAESELRTVHESGRDRLVDLLPPPKHTRRKSA
jgi:predicted DNA-binding transcriptional regulator AlpA